MHISPIFSHFAMKIVIEGNQQKVEQKFDKKKFGFFFSGKRQKMDPKIGNFEGWFPANGPGRPTCHAHQMKALIKGINLMCVTLYGNVWKPFKIGLE